MRSLCDQITRSFSNCVAQVPSLASYKDDFESRLQDLAGLNLRDRKEADLIVNSLRNLVGEGPTDAPFRADFRARTGAVARLLDEVTGLMRAHPAQQLYDVIPKPHYADRPFELDGEVALDAFIDDMSVSKTFYSMAAIAGLTPASMH